MTVLVLSGGGLWALAGLGVAKALQEMNVTIDGYVGTSAGAMVATLLALGHSPCGLQEIALRLRSGGLSGVLKPWGRALVRGRWPTAVGSLESVFACVQPLWSARQWEDLTAPVWVVATSLTQRHPIVFGPGEPAATPLSKRCDLDWGATILPLQQAVRASMAFPGLVDPVVYAHGVLVDGGVTDDYPVDVAAWLGADHIIGVWVDEQRVYALPRVWHAGHIATGAVTAMIRELSIIRMRQVTIPRMDVRIEMDGGHRVWSRVDDIMQRGYDEMWKRHAEVVKLLPLGGY